jgi:hypothetical protein
MYFSAKGGSTLKMRHHVPMLTNIYEERGVPPLSLLSESSTDHAWPEHSQYLLN